MRSPNIPTVLQQRYDNLMALDEAYELLDAISRNGEKAGPEAQFIAGQIETLEREIEESEAEATRLIDLLNNDPIAWTAVRLRFFHGYAWKHVAVVIGQSETATKSCVYRRLREIMQQSAE